MGENRIFVSCDASDWRTGAVLSYGPTLEFARPVAYDLMQLSNAKLNYPVHEKELLAVVRQYDFNVEYILGETNSVADALSYLPPDVNIDILATAAVTTSLRIATSPAWLESIRRGYKKDPWCKRLCDDGTTIGFREEHRHLYIGT
ncbi:hypothetical protein PsYK624_171420 [Phanerochaete sordida]|uniref:Reverse transcriptase RNase H-like domain-containing protein n=1 Tax=Phanerochaete sordida TaxID=48140 RepID=A0A9P3LP62_9APHY|nr:hypothetical protein PsYK624_171420 [Phanerochaete sordida]